MFELKKCYILKMKTLLFTPYATTFGCNMFSLQVSLILRGANDYMLDEMDRALHDALCIVKRTLESNTVSALHLHEPLLSPSFFP